MTNYLNTINNSTAILNDINSKNFNSTYGVNFIENNDNYILIPIDSQISLLKPYIISFKIFVKSYNNKTANYVFNQGMLYNKDNRNYGNGLGITMSVTSESNIQFNIYEEVINFPKTLNIPITNLINNWTDIIISVTPTKRGNSYIIYINGSSYKIKSSYVNIDLALTQISNIILGSQPGNGSAFNGYIKDFAINQEYFAPSNVINEYFTNIPSNESNESTFLKYVKLYTYLGIIFYSTIFIKNINYDDIIPDKNISFALNTLLLVCGFIMIIS